MSKIAITGANGYLGSHLVKQLIKENKTVFSIIRKNSCLDRLKGITCKCYYTDELDALFQDNKIDTVIHTATCYGRNGETDQTILQANLYFPFDILTKFIISHGNMTKKFINIDTVLPKNTNVYALSKRQFQDWLKFYCKQENSTSIINVILNYMYGPYDDISKFTTFIIDQCRQNNDQVIPLTSGEQKKDFIYIDDIINAISLLCDAAYKESYIDIELGSGATHSIKHYAQTVHKLLNSKAKLGFGLKSKRTEEKDMPVANINQLQKLGWQPKYDLEAGLAKTILTESRKIK